MLPLLAVAALGFSLTGEGRRLAKNNEPCQADCDDGFDADCDEQDESGDWSFSCDLHPTTSCDSDCLYPPPPPTAPWLGDHGTYPSPPPPPPPTDREVLVIGASSFLVALCFLCVVCILVNYGRGNGTTGERSSYWCCCIMPSRRGSSSWYDDDEPKNAKEDTEGVEGALEKAERPTSKLTLPSIALK